MRAASEPVPFGASRLMLGLGLTLLGALVLTDRPGLRQEYFALSADWQGDPVYTGTGNPQLESHREVAEVLVSREIFSLRWTGWLVVEEAGPFRFALRADEAAYLRIDGQSIGDSGQSQPSRRAVGELELDRGVHAIEVGSSQTRGPSRLEIDWGAMGESPQAMAGPQLVARRPVNLRRIWRRFTSGIPAGGQRILGWLMALGGLVLAGPGLGWVTRPARDALERWYGGPRRQGWVMLGAMGLLLTVCLLSFPFTSATADGDDVRYMDGALFNKQMGWNMNRYAHIYLLKGFIEAAQGDVFLASRWQWSVTFGITVAALFVAVQGLGPGLQWRTLAVVLLLLFSQPRLLGGIGAAYADYTAMMFVVLGLAVYMHGYATQPTSSSRWHAMLLGALTIGAGKSKEPGAIMLWFAILLLWSAGHVNLRRFLRRMLWWVLGACAAYLVLMTLDAIVLGDFWFSLRPGSFAGAEKLLDAAEAKWQLSRFSWLGLPWDSGPLRGLAIVSILAPITAFALRKPMELRLIALTPLIFMAMMIAVHPPTLTPRYLFPIIPIACFVGGMMAYDLALGASSWRGLFSVRTALISIALVAMFGAGLVETRTALVHRTAFQRGELILYPWRMFADSIETERPKRILVSNRLHGKYQMIGKKKTRERIARMFFERRHLDLIDRPTVLPEVGMAVGDREDYRRWRADLEDSGGKASFDPSGRIVLIRRE